MSVSSLAKYLLPFRAGLDLVKGKAGILFHLHYAVCTSCMPSSLVYKPLHTLCMVFLLRARMRSKA